MVYGLFFPLVIGIPMLIFMLTAWLNLPAILSILSIPTGIVAAWVWWSVRVPQWRVWALEQIEDIEVLHEKAVQAGIEWPYGHFFEHTEIKSQQLSQQEVSLQLHHYLRRIEQQLEKNNNINGDTETYKQIRYAISYLSTGQVLPVGILQGITQDLRQLMTQELDSEAAKTRLSLTLFFVDKYHRIFNT